MAKVLTIVLMAALLSTQPSKPRARDLGVPFEGTPGSLNAITDVTGIEVGMTTLIEGEGPLQVGKGPVRTGVTAILPRGKGSADPVMAGWFSMNGNGEMTGTAWIKEGGFMEGPVFITAHGIHVGERVRRHFPRVLDGQREGGVRARRRDGPDALERSDQRGVLGDCAGDGRGDRQRAGGG